MDAAPCTFDELPHDAEHGVPVPFACGGSDPYADPGGPPPSARALDKRRVTQCALSRVCGVCGSVLGRPLVLIGTAREVGRNAFLLPPAHLECAGSLFAAYAGVTEPVFGQDDVPATWQLVTTAGFEFVRPGRDDADDRPTFQPNSLLAQQRVG
ncbi:MAG: hypothetical protein ABWX84_05755 [Nocardioides sp.]